jgi:hypothetical protein
VVPPILRSSNFDASAQVFEYVLLEVFVTSSEIAQAAKAELFHVWLIENALAVVSEIVPRANPVMAVLFAIDTPKSVRPVIVPEVMAATELAPPVVPTKTFESALRRLKFMSR